MPRTIQPFLCSCILGSVSSTGKNRISPIPLTVTGQHHEQYSGMNQHPFPFLHAFAWFVYGRVGYLCLDSSASNWRYSIDTVLFPLRDLLSSQVSCLYFTYSTRYSFAIPLLVFSNAALFSAFCSGIFPAICDRCALLVRGRTPGTTGDGGCTTQRGKYMTWCIFCPGKHLRSEERVCITGLGRVKAPCRSAVYEG